MLENDQPPNCCDLQVNQNNAIKKETSKQFKQNERSTGHSHRPLNYWQLCTCARLPLAIVCAWYTQKRLLELHEKSVFDLEWRRHKMHKMFMRRNSIYKHIHTCFSVIFAPQCHHIHSFWCEFFFVFGNSCQLQFPFQFQYSVRYTFQLIWFDNCWFSIIMRTVSSHLIGFFHACKWRFHNAITTPKKDNKRKLIVYVKRPT